MTCSFCFHPSFNNDFIRALAMVKIRQFVFEETAEVKNDFACSVHANFYRTSFNSLHFSYCIVRKALAKSTIKMKVYCLQSFVFCMI